jgi:HK97 family phage portal protein
MPAGWISPHTQAGIDVSPETALNFSAVFGAINVISTDIAALPCITYRKGEGGSKEPDPTHPLYDMLMVEPNGEVDAFHFPQTLFMHCLGHGDGYAEIGRLKSNGQAAKIWNLDPRDVRPTRDRRKRLVYELQNGRHILPENMIHLKGISHDGIKGISVVSRARQSIGLGIAAEIYGAAYFGNGARAGGYLKSKTKPDQSTLDDLREDLENLHGGPFNAHKLGFLVGDWEYIETGLSPEDSQLLATRAFSILEICRWFNISPFKLMDFSQGNYSNVEQSLLDHVTTTLTPWLVNYENELNRKLLTRTDRQKYLIKHDLQARLRGDSAARMNYYKNGWGIGIFSQNDIRRMEDLNPIEYGDVYYIPANNMVASKLAATGQFTPPSKLVGDDAGVDKPKGDDSPGSRWISPVSADNPRRSVELLDAAIRSIYEAA